MSVHYRRTSCRLCDSTSVELCFSLESSPLAESYLPPSEAHKADARYPMGVYLCASCGGCQMLDIIDPGILFDDYSYTSSSSPSLARHFQKYATEVCERFKPVANSLVVEVGSNDGLLLRQFKERGMRVVGVDPARAIAAKATTDGIPTLPAFMNLDTASDIRQHGEAAIVVANNCLAHAEQPGVILDGIHDVLDDSGVLILEVSHLPDLIENLVFDWIYHEHGIFYTLSSLSSLLCRHGLELFDVQRVPTKGGSIRGFAQKRGGPHKFVSSISKFVAEPRVYRNFIARVNMQREITQTHLREYRDRNLRVVGFGASATTTTLLHHFQIGGMLDFLVDDNPRLHGLVSPGYHLPVKSPEALYGPSKPDAVYICAWRFVDVIIERHRRYLDEGGVFITPLPIYKETAK